LSPTVSGVPHWFGRRAEERGAVVFGVGDWRRGRGLGRVWRGGGAVPGGFFHEGEGAASGVVPDRGG